MANQRSICTSATWVKKTPAASPAELRSTPVDGVDVLGALSPSRASDFMTCPLLYRYRTIDRLPEEPSADALRGTLVHKVLEDLFDLPAQTRTPDQARDLERVMADLPARTRDLIRATRIEGLSTREAAQRHGMTETAAKVAIHRGLKSLGGQYGGSDVEGD